MVGHVGQSASPVCDGKVCVPPPGISIICIAAPRPLGDVIVEMNVNLIGGTLCCNSIEDLFTTKKDQVSPTAPFCSPGLSSSPLIDSPPVW